MKQFYNCLAALAITAAALATPSAFGYRAVYAEPNNLRFNIFVGDEAASRELAIQSALARCNWLSAMFGPGTWDCDIEQADIFLYTLNGDDNSNPNCISLSESRPDERLLVPAYGNILGDIINNEYITELTSRSFENCEALLDNVTDTSCDVRTIVDGTANTPIDIDNGGSDIDLVNKRNPYVVCDTRVCEDHEFANETTGKCEPCTAGTHVIVGGICTEQEICTENNVRNPDNLATCMPCDTPGEIADSDNTTCIPIPKKIEPITQVSVSVQISVTFLSVTLTMNTVRTSLNIITVTATNGEKIAVTTTSGSMLTITTANGEEILVINNGSATGTPGSDGQGGSTAINTITDDDHQKTAALAAGIGLGVGAIVLGLYYFVNDSPDIIIYEPGYSFSGYNDNLSYSLHNRWTATTDNWRFYWQANQTNDKFVYSSGMRYNNGILSAAMNSESEKDKTALDLQLSANKTVGLWNLGGGVNFDMQLSETDMDTQNRINAKIRYKMDKWILSADAKTNGKRATARINYIYRF